MAGIFSSAASLNGAFDPANWNAIMGEELTDAGQALPAAEDTGAVVPVEEKAPVPMQAAAPAPAKKPDLEQWVVQLDENGLVNGTSKELIYRMQGTFHNKLVVDKVRNTASKDNFARLNIFLDNITERATRKVVVEQILPVIKNLQGEMLDELYKEATAHYKDKPPVIKPSGLTNNLTKKLDELKALKRTEGIIAQIAELEVALIDYHKRDFYEHYARAALSTDANLGYRSALLYAKEKGIQLTVYRKVKDKPNTLEIIEVHSPEWSASDERTFAWVLEDDGYTNISSYIAASTKKLYESLEKSKEPKKKAELPVQTYGSTKLQQTCPLDFLEDATGIGETTALPNAENDEDKANEDKTTEEKTAPNKQPDNKEPVLYYRNKKIPNLSTIQMENSCTGFSAEYFPNKLYAKGFEQQLVCFMTKQEMLLMREVYSTLINNKAALLTSVESLTAEEKIDYEKLEEFLNFSTNPKWQPLRELAERIENKIAEMRVAGQADEDGAVYFRSGSCSTKFVFRRNKNDKYKPTNMALNGMDAVRLLCCDKRVHNSIKAYLDPSAKGPNGEDFYPLSILVSQPNKKISELGRAEVRSFIMDRGKDHPIELMITSYEDKNIHPHQTNIPASDKVAVAVTNAITAFIRTNIELFAPFLLPFGLFKKTLTDKGIRLGENEQKNDAAIELIRQFSGDLSCNFDSAVKITGKDGAVSLETDEKDAKEKVIFIEFNNAPDPQGMGLADPNRFKNHEIAQRQLPKWIDVKPGTEDKEGRTAGEADVKANPQKPIDYVAAAAVRFTYSAKARLLAGSDKGRGII